MGWVVERVGSSASRGCWPAHCCTESVGYDGRIRCFEVLEFSCSIYFFYSAIFGYGPSLWPAFFYP